MPAPTKYNILFSDETEKDSKGMLTMEQVYNIKYMRKFEGKSLRKIAKITGHDFYTIKRYVDKEDYPKIIKQQQKKKKLTVY